MDNNKQFFAVTTTENTKAWIRKSDISAIEAVPGTTRTEGYIKLYVAGYHFGVKMELEELEKILLEED